MRVAQGADEGRQHTRVMAARFPPGPRLPLKCCQTHSLHRCGNDMQPKMGAGSPALPQRSVLLIGMFAILVLLPVTAWVGYQAGAHMAPQSMRDCSHLVFEHGQQSSGAATRSAAIAAQPAANASTDSQPVDATGYALQQKHGICKFLRQGAGACRHPVDPHPARRTLCQRPVRRPCPLTLPPCRRTRTAGLPPPPRRPRQLAQRGGLGPRPAEAV